MNIKDIITAIKTASLETISSLIDDNIICIDDQWLDYIAVTTAISCGRKDVTEMLLKKGSRVNKTTKPITAVDTPLHHAVKLKDSALIGLLMNKGASIVCANWDGNTPLHLAFLMKFKHGVNEILNLTREFSNPKNNYGLTHFHIACTRKNARIIENFLNGGIDVHHAVKSNAPIWAGFKAVDFAIKFKSTQALRILKNHGVSVPEKVVFDSPNTVNGSHTTIKDEIGTSKTSTRLNGKGISGVAANNHIDKKSVISDKLIVISIAQSAAEFTGQDTQKNSNQTTSNFQSDLNKFHKAVINNDLEKVNEFLNNGLDVNQRVTHQSSIYQNLTALHLSVEHKNLEVARLLIENGAKVNADESKRGTPLHIAFASGLKDFIELLFLNDADPLLRRSDGKTTLHLLFTDNKFGDLKLHGNEISSSQTILMYAEQLLELGVDVNSQDNDGNTVLHLLLMNDSDWKYEYALYLRFLLDSGSDINIANLSGELPFKISVQLKSENYEKINIFYNHAQKLKVLGLKVHCGYDECLKLIEVYYNNRNICQYNDAQKAIEVRKEEISKLQSVKIGEYATLLDFLKIEPKRAAIYVQSRSLRKIVENEDLNKNFPEFGFLIRLQYRKAIAYLSRKD